MGCVGEARLFGVAALDPNKGCASTGGEPFRSPVSTAVAAAAAATLGAADQVGVPGLGSLAPKTGAGSMGGGWIWGAARQTPGHHQELSQLRSPRPRERRVRPGH